MEWEKMLEEYLNLLESFSGVELFNRLSSAEDPVERETNRQDREREVLSGSGFDERLPTDAERVVTSGSTDGSEALSRQVGSLAEGLMAGAEDRFEGVFSQEDRPVDETVPEDEAARQVLFSALYTALVGNEGDRFQEEKGISPAEQEVSSGEAVFQALERLMPEEAGLVFKPVDPLADSGEGGTDGKVFLWQEAAEKSGSSDGSGETVPLYTASKPNTEWVEGRMEDGFADRLLDELEARLRLELGSGAEGFYR